MTEGNFVDYIKIYASSGKGGQGSMHLHREKFITKGGPDGGDGGRGGHIILRGDKNMWTLFHLKFKRHFRADPGGAGSASRSTGADGADVYVDVPLGTIVRDADTDEVILEITEHQKEVVLLRGGKGGLGNWHFKSSTNQTPRYSQPGMDGVEAWLRLELKLLADVGLVWFSKCREIYTFVCFNGCKTENCRLCFYNVKTKFRYRRTSESSNVRNCRHSWDHRRRCRRKRTWTSISTSYRTKLNLIVFNSCR